MGEMEFLKELRSKHFEILSNIDSRLEALEKAPVEVIAEDALPLEDIERMNWRRNSKGTGFFIPIKGNPKAEKIKDLITKSGKKKLELYGYVFTTFGEDNGLIGKFPKRK